MAFSPDGGQAVTASRDGTWCVWGLGVRHWLQEDPKKLLQVRALSRRRVHAWWQLVERQLDEQACNESAKRRSGMPHRAAKGLF